MSIRISDQSALAEREAVIESGLMTFVEVGNALLYIRDNALYQTVAGFKTFELYCKERWQMDGNYARKLIRSAETVKNLQNGTTVPLPKTERQARPLTQLETPEQQQEAWQTAVEASNGKPTAKHVEAAVEQIQERTEPAPKVPRYVPADGLKYAELAILNLEKIQPNDSQRDAAFARVTKWITKNQ